jgi:protein SCO1/2
MTRRAALAALVMVLAVTAAWWALALWPTGPAAPAWLERTREVCFGVSRNGLPDVAGWAVLISEPFGMLAFLGLVWRDELVETLGELRRTTLGRMALGVASVVLASGICAATVRVATATPTSVAFDAGSSAQPAPDRLDRTAPALSLVDQHGTTVRLEDFRGRPVMIAFAYAHCQTVCPLLVHDAIAATERAKESDPALLIVTLDPWRDTPARLAAITRAWNLPAGVRLLGGTVAEVERTLDGWKIPRARDGNTGEIVHPTGVYFIDKRGRLAFIASGDASRLAAVIERL